jgi:hypothetical protein
MAITLPELPYDYDALQLDWEFAERNFARLQAVVV